MTNLEKLLAAGASVIIRPTGSPSFRFFKSKYVVAVEYDRPPYGFVVLNGLFGDDLEEILGRGLEWVEELKFYSGSQWTPEQMAQMKRAAG